MYKPFTTAKRWSDKGKVILVHATKAYGGGQ